MFNFLFIRKQILIFIIADVGGQLGLFCGASVITIIEIIEYVFTNFYWICIFFLLKISEITQQAPPPQNHPENKNKIDIC
jgi:acid-sensing ion channel 5